MLLDRLEKGQHQLRRTDVIGAICVDEMNFRKYVDDHFSQPIEGFGQEYSSFLKWKKARRSGMSFPIFRFILKQIVLWKQNNCAILVIAVTVALIITTIILRG